MKSEYESHEKVVCPTCKGLGMRMKRLKFTKRFVEKAVTCRTCRGECTVLVWKKEGSNDRENTEH